MKTQLEKMRENPPKNLSPKSIEALENYLYFSQGKDEYNISKSTMMKIVYHKDCCNFEDLLNPTITFKTIDAASRAVTILKKEAPKYFSTISNENGLYVLTIGYRE